MSTYRNPTTLAQRAARVDERTREAQARLADKSFSAFVKAHNAKLDRIARKGA